MKLLRRNNEQSGKGGMSNAEIRHLKAVSLLQEMSLADGPDGHGSERQSLHPKRLLCFSNKPKKDQYPEERREQSPWRSRSIMDDKTRRKNGDLSAMCNELCDDYYEIRKNLRQRPHAATAKKTLLLEAVSTSPSTASSSVEAPLRKFDRRLKTRTNSNLHYSNENRERHRRQRSLMDDNISVQSEQIKSNANWNPNKFTIRRSRPKKNSGPKTSKSSKSSKSSSHGSNSRQSSSKRSYREKEIQPKSSSISEYTEDTLPVSVVEQKKIHNNVSTISTMTSRSYTTCDDVSVILSPRAANERVKKQSAPSRVNYSLGCTPVTPCAQPQPQARDYTTPSPRKANILNTDLGVIREDYDYSSSSGSLASSASFSSYGSSYSSGSYADYSGSGTEYYDDASLFYESSHKSEVMSKGRMKRTEKSTSRGHDDHSRTRNSTLSYEQRDDHYKYYYP